MTALSGETLRDAGVTTFNELQNFVPNLEIIPVTDTRSTSIRIRGIGSVGSNAGIDPSVGVFIDGVYQGRAGMSVGDLLDIERVEVLRGPQGTLYGKNTAAGAINIITRDPDFEQSVFLEGVAGKYDDLQFRGSANFPLLEDELALRVAGYSSKRDGWDINRFNGQDVNNVDKWGMRAKLLWDVNDDLSLLLTGDYSEEDSRSFVPEIIDYKADGPSVMNTPFGYFAELNGVTLPNADPFDFSVGANVQPINRVEVGGVSLDALYAAGEHDIRWLNAWRTYSTDSQFDGDFSAFDGVLVYQDVDLNQFSSELTLTSPTHDWVEYQGGLYFFYMNMDTSDRNGWEQGLVDVAQFACAPGNSSPASTCPLFPPLIFSSPTRNINTNTHETKTVAGYGQATWNLIDELSLETGLRVSWEEKNRSGSTHCTTTAGTDCPEAGLFGPDIPDRSESFTTTKVQWRFALQYEPTADAMFYASVANGFKSGGYNQLRTPVNVSDQFADEKSINYELGARTSWLDRQLVFNLTGYFTDYDDFQAQVFDGSAITILNAGRLFSYGFESDFIYMPDEVENLRMGGSLSLNIARYDIFPSGVSTVPQQVDLTEASPFAAVPAGVACSIALNCSQDLSGQPLDNAPEWDVSAFASYEYPLPATSLALFTRADYAYTGSLYLDQDLDPNLFQSGYHLLNLRAGLRAEDHAWSLTLWATNVTNSEYLVIGFDVPIISGYAGVRGPPRQVGATLRLNF
jgi:iron complex outermembrane receptor protein